MEPGLPDSIVKAEDEEVIKRDGVVTYVKRVSFAKESAEGATKSEGDVSDEFEVLEVPVIVSNASGKEDVRADARDLTSTHCTLPEMTLPPRPPPSPETAPRTTHTPGYLDVETLRTPDPVPENVVKDPSDMVLVTSDPLQLETPCILKSLDSRIQQTSADLNSYIKKFNEYEYRIGCKSHFSRILCWP